jgi:hypothetical protein
MTKGRLWPSGTGKWSKVRTVIVSADREHREQLRQQLRADTIVVATPLELISSLEDSGSLVTTIILAGAIAKNSELTSFLCESYPTLQVLDGRADTIPDTYLPPFS